MASTETNYKPGDYILQYVGIIGTSGEKINIVDQITELNIYQSIDSPNMSGDIVIADNDATAEVLPFIGQERILFTLRTPSTSDKVDFETYHAVVSNIANRFTSTEHTQVYKLEFVTPEAYANTRTKVSQSFKGELSTIVEEIFRDVNYLNSKKKLFIEKTKGIVTYVSPNLRPFQVIRHLAEQSISDEDQHNGYVFFENTKGYHFRSLDSLMGKSLGNTLTPTSKVYKLQPAGSTDKEVQYRKDSILELAIVDSFDTLGSTRSGLYGSTLLYHDVFNKNVLKKEYHYFDTGKRVGTNANKANFGPIASKTSVNGKTFADWPESRIFLHSTSSDNLHTEGIDNNADEWLQNSASRYYEQDYQQLRILTYGDASVCAGDIVQIQIPSSKRKPKIPDPSSYDPILSGRYLVADLKHSVDPKVGTHGMTLKLIKDSVQNEYPAQSLDFGDPPDGGTVTLSSRDYITASEVNSLQAKL